MGEEDHVPGMERRVVHNGFHAIVGQAKPSNSAFPQNFQESSDRDGSGVSDHCSVCAVSKGREAFLQESGDEASFQSSRVDGGDDYRVVGEDQVEERDVGSCSTPRFAL